MKNIVVLGTGVAAMPLIRQTMRNTVLPSSDYKLIVISPSDHFIWPIALPRAIVPGQYGDEKVLFPLGPVFDEFPSDKFEFIHASATSVDPENNIVRAGEKQVGYHTLIVATGSTAKDGYPWKIVGDEQETKRLLRKAREDIKKAKSVAVIGAGLTGAETAGELAFEYSQKGQKEVYLIYNSALPLYDDVIESARKQVVIELERMKAKLIPNTNVTKMTAQANGETLLELTNKDGSTKTLTVGAVVNSTGMVPNTSFMPASLLNSNGTLKQDGFLRSPSHKNIFILGDAGSIEPAKGFLADGQTRWLIKHLPKYFSSDGDLPTEPYKKEGTEPSNVVALTLGRSKGTGQIAGFKFPSIMVWWMKGRHLGTDHAEEIAKGKRTMMAVFEK